MPQVRVELPFHLCSLAGIAGREVVLELPEEATTADLLDAVEARYAALCGTVRDHGTGARRGYLRFFACQEDLSFEPLSARLPEPVLAGLEPFLILGAVSGG
jgi:molybdopterin synthase sulfur carrier subunit